MKKFAILGMFLSTFFCGLLLANETIGRFLDAESNVREGASAKSKILFVSKTGEEFKVIGRDGQKWLKVQLRDGREGWTNIINVKLETLPSSENEATLSDFHGTWIENLPGGEEPLPLFIESLSEEKFIITSGTIPKKLAIKNANFNAEANALVITLESFDEETQKISQEKWTLKLTKGTKKGLEIIGPSISGNFSFSTEKMSSDIEIAFKELRNHNTPTRVDEKTITTSFPNSEISSEKPQNNAIVISNSNLSVRAEPTPSSKKIGSLLPGQSLEILEKTQIKMVIEGLEDYWYKIRCAEQEGFVFGGFIKITENIEVVADSPVISDFHGSWESTENAGQIFINVEDLEKFVVTNGECACKMEAKIKEFIPNKATLILTVEFTDEGEETPDISDWEIRLSKNAHNEKQIEVVYCSSNGKPQTKEIFNFVSTTKSNEFAWLDQLEANKSESTTQESNSITTSASSVQNDIALAEAEKAKAKEEMNRILEAAKIVEMEKEKLRQERAMFEAERVQNANNNVAKNQENDRSLEEKKLNDELAREKESIELERQKLETEKEQLKQKEQQLQAVQTDLERYAEKQQEKLDERIERFKNDQEKLAIVKKLLSENRMVAYSDVIKACKVLSSDEVNEILVNSPVSWEGWVYNYYGGTIRQRKCAVDMENRSPTTGHVVFAIQDKDVEHGWIFKDGSIAVGNHIAFKGKIESIYIGLLGGITVYLKEVTSLHKYSN